VNDRDDDPENLRQETRRDRHLRKRINPRISRKINKINLTK